MGGRGRVFTDKNSNSLEIEYKTNITLVIN